MVKVAPLTVMFDPGASPALARVCAESDPPKRSKVFSMPLVAPSVLMPSLFIASVKLAVVTLLRGMASMRWTPTWNGLRLGLLSGMSVVVRVMTCWPLVRCAPPRGP
jgi:hypothetical protein